MHPVETEHDREEEGHGCVDEEGVEGAGSGLCVREGGELDGQPVGAKKKKKKKTKGSDTEATTNTSEPALGFSQIEHIQQQENLGH